MGEKKGHPIHPPHLHICSQAVLVFLVNPRAVCTLPFWSAEAALVPGGVGMGRRVVEEEETCSKHQAAAGSVLNLTATRSSRGNTPALHFLTIPTLNQMVSLLLLKRKQLLIKKLFK